MDESDGRKLKPVSHIQWNLYCTSLRRPYWKINIKESVKSGKTKKNRRLVFLTALALFMIKIKFTQYNNA